MAQTHRLAILSDVHYAGPSEQLRGNDYEYRDLPNPLQRLLCHAYRHLFWLRHPLNHNSLLDQFMARVDEPDHVFALGDYTCDTAFVGVSDEAALQSAAECLGKLGSRFGNRLHALIGDHELGKFPLFGKRGGLRFKSWQKVRDQLGLSAFWRLEIGQHVCLGITSSLVALPALSDQLLEEERADWEALRQHHLQEIRDGFESVSGEQRILLFCHDPTALPFLSEEPAVGRRLDRIDQTFIGHLHSPLILWKSRRLSGMPTIPFLGHSAKRLSRALGRAQLWKPFRVRLCPSLAGIELLKDGGFCTAEISGNGPGRFTARRHRIRR